jgi:hypothetical protein
MKHEETIKRLDQEIQTLRIECERFFNGDLKLPPEKARNDLQTSIRSLLNSPLTNYAERFRISTLEAKFNSFNELFLRRMRKLEDGDLLFKAPVASAARPRPQKKKRKPLNRVAPVQIAKVLDTEAPSQETLQALYGEIQKATPSRPLPDFQKFSRTLSTQLSKLRTKTGCREVQINCTPNGGKLKLVVKPIKYPKTATASG